jgi:hypothetical protein
LNPATAETKRLFSHSFQKWLESRLVIEDIDAMTPTESAANQTATAEEMQKGWLELLSKVAQLEADQNILKLENKSLRSLLERVIEHRAQSHGELVLLLTGLVSKLPINDVGFVISKLIEHNTQVSQVCATLTHSKPGAELPKPTAMKVFEQTKRDLSAALKPAVEDLMKTEAPLPADMLLSLVAQPKLFSSPVVIRANRCFVKGQLPRERIVKEFGEAALPLFNDMTTDAKLNPRPKSDEIVLGFKPDFETLLQSSTLAPEKRQELLGLYQKVQRSKAATEQAAAQKSAFLKLSFLLELLNYYENQGTESSDVIFAQRLPTLIEQLVIANQRDNLDEKLIQPAEALMSFIINPDHRHTIINNIGKAGGVPRTLRFVLMFRADKVPEPERNRNEFIKHLIPAPKAPAPEAIAIVLRLVHPDHQQFIVRGIVSSDRLSRADAEALSFAVGKELGLKGLVEQIKAESTASPEGERKIAWDRIKEMIENRADPAAVSAAVRNRLHAKYDDDEVKQSWITLTGTDPMSLVRTFCQLPYLPDGNTDPIARAVLESYVSRLMHEKYADIYTKVVKSLTNMFKVKADSPTLVNFLSLVKWVDAAAAKKLATDIGMPVAA